MEVLLEKERIYLDYNATTPLASFLVKEIPYWFQEWANPSSIYKSGTRVKSLLTKAREQVAEFVGCEPLEIVFTSGGSESNNYAIKGLCEKFKDSSRKKIITSTVEHSSVDSSLKWAEKQGYEVIRIPVSREGQIDINEYKKAMNSSVAFVTMMYANNETGCIFPINELVEISQSYEALFHCDGVQALGKTPLNIRDLNVDFLTLSSHKFYSLKGSGILFIKKGQHIPSLILGGPQERKRRAGTENTLAHIAFGAVCAKGKEILEHAKELTLLRDHFESNLEKEIEGIHFVGKKYSRICNSSSVLINDISAETLLMRLDLNGFSVSVSSACQSGSLSPSQILLGMGYSINEAKSILRISIGLGIDKKAIHHFISNLSDIIKHLRKIGK